ADGGVAGIIRWRAKRFVVQRAGVSVAGAERACTAIGRGLAIDGVRGRSNERLVKGNREHFVGAMVADVTEAEEPVIGSLILQIEGPVLGIGNMIVHVITAEQEGAEEIAGWPVSRSGLG